MTWCNFLHVSYAWGLWRFGDLWVYSFYQILKMFSLIFLNIFSILSTSTFETSVIQSLSLLQFPISLFILFSLCVLFWVFYIYIWSKSIIMIIIPGSLYSKRLSFICTIQNSLKSNSSPKIKDLPFFKDKFNNHWQN